jgi:hypothetical protein
MKFVLTLPAYWVQLKYILVALSVRVKRDGLLKVLNAFLNFLFNDLKLIHSILNRMY